MKHVGIGKSIALRRIVLYNENTKTIKRHAAHADY